MPSAPFSVSRARFLCPRPFPVETLLEMVSEIKFTNMALESGHLPSPELLDDICVRFILTLPATELE